MEISCSLLDPQNKSCKKNHCHPEPATAGEGPPQCLHRDIARRSNRRAPPLTPVFDSPSSSSALYRKHLRVEFLQSPPRRTKDPRKACTSSAARRSSPQASLPSQVVCQGREI